MDSLTQIVLGAAVGEAVLGKKVGNRAMLYGAIAGTIPDLDVISRYFVDTVTAIEWHRGFSHSILFSVLFAPLFGWIISKIERPAKASWRDWSLLMFWGLFTHPLLDSFTTWGTQLFWPFDLRLAFQSIFVIDPLYTLPFLCFLILAMRLPISDPRRSKYNRWGLILSSAYLLLTIGLKTLAYSSFIKNLENQKIQYHQIEIRPTPFNTILWTANIDMEDAYLIGEYSFFDTKPIRFTPYRKNHELLGELSSNDKIQRLIKVTKGWYTISMNAKVIVYNDLRFGLIKSDPLDPIYAFSYKLLPFKDKLKVEEVPKYKGDAREVLSGLWYRIWGGQD
ncbi:metal-dependent hydrolase [Eudoraea chungangensis]|uniref:metal-dependent hydrolase n=1 Tax=Eudoraea chungangensis TaxID=1481905 RepID=UPI0023EBADDA|nr:metal-dependent hydrolase [Eudoraea chungangensis]